MPSNLHNAINNLNNFNITVIGDFCLDQYWHLDTAHDRQLDYNTLPTFGLSRAVYTPGGAGNVVNNFIQLGYPVQCVGLLGDDGAGYQLAKCLSTLGADTTHMVTVPDRITHTCIRPIRVKNGVKTELNEIITVNLADTPQGVQKLITSRLAAICAQSDAVVMVEQFDDNNQGIFTDIIRAELIALSKIHDDKIFLIDSRKYIDRYDNMYLKCNQHEFAEIERENVRGFKGLFVTRGENGMNVTDAQNHTTTVPGIQQTGQVNTCGAGDAATAGIVTGLLLGYTLEDAARLGNLTASIAIRNLETTGYATQAAVRAALAVIASPQNCRKNCTSFSKR